MRPALFTAASAAALALATAAAAETVSYDAAGEPYEGYFAPAQGEAQGLVLIVHDWDGLGDYEMRRADMLAELGYDAFALDLFGANENPQSVEDNRRLTGALYQDREAMRTRLQAGLEAARAQSEAEQVVVMGYCFGGAATLEMARSVSAEGVVGYASFHGGLATPEGQSYPEDVAPILILHGGADESVTLAEFNGLLEELEQAGITYTGEVYSGAPHAFTVFDSDRYRERADEESWESFRDFLGDRFAAEES